MKVLIAASSVLVGCEDHPNMAAKYITGAITGIAGVMGGIAGGVMGGSVGSIVGSAIGGIGMGKALKADNKTIGAGALGMIPIIAVIGFNNIGNGIGHAMSMGAVGTLPLVMGISVYERINNFTT